MSTHFGAGAAPIIGSAMFVPGPHEPPPPRIDHAHELRDVLARVTIAGRELVIGLDLGRVVRVVPATALDGLPARAAEQLAACDRTIALFADELYLLDVQAVEKQPDRPGADDPLYLYGVLRGPYPEALAAGVVAREGQLATTRGALLDGLALGIERAFRYERGACGTRCVHAALPFHDLVSPRAVVLAFPLVPMGDDGSNELVAGQLIHDVLGALRADLGDDLAADPVPVPSRAAHERALIAGGWTIEGDVAVHHGGRSRLASLFTPARKQRLPRELALDGYRARIAAQLARLPGWTEPARVALHERIGLRPPPPPHQPAGPPPRVPRQPRRPRPPPSPPSPPPSRAAGRAARGAPSPTPPPPPPPPPGAAPAGAWMAQLISAHLAPGRPAPRVTTPGRVAGGLVPDWMLDLIEHEFPDD